MGIISEPNFLTVEEKAIFERDGVVCLRGVMSQSEIADLRKGVSKQMNGFGRTHTGYDFEAIAKQVFDGAPAVETSIDTQDADRFDMSEIARILTADEKIRPIRDEVTSDQDGMFFYDAAGWRFYEEFRRPALDSSLPSLCAKLMDSTYINFWEDTTFVKAPNTSQRTPFHQDYGYFQIRGTKCCIVWIALDEVNSGNGAMQYVRGSHNWGKKYAPNLLVSQTPFPDSPYERLPDLEANIEDYDIISFDVQPGDVIIHHVMTLHGSSGNTSNDRMRRAVAFRYCGDDITYYDRPGAVVQPYLEDKLENGAKLFSKDYPIVWPRPFPEFKLSDLF